MMTTYMAQLDWPLLGCPDPSRRTDRHVRLGAGTGRGHGRWRRQPAPGGQGSRRRRRRDHAVELPDRDRAEQAGPGPRDGQHGSAEARSEHAVDLDPHRQADRRAHRHSRRGRQRRAHSRQRGGRAAGHRPHGWTWFRSPDPPTWGASSRRRGAESLKRVFLELGGKSAMVILDDADLDEVLPNTAQVCMHAGQGCADQHANVGARPCLRRVRPEGRPRCSNSSSPAIRRSPRPSSAPSSTPNSRAGSWVSSTGRGRRVPRSPPADARRSRSTPTWPAATTSCPPSLPAWTTPTRSRKRRCSAL